MNDPEQLTDTWRCIARSRAVENTSYVIVTQNAYQMEGFEYENNIAAGAFVATPETIQAQRKEAGILTTELDMDRLEYLRRRNYDEQILSRPEGEVNKLGCRPGQIWERRPELFEALVEEQNDFYD